MKVRRMLVAALLLTVAAQAAVSPAVFRSFEYTGRDAAFDAPLPPESYRNPILAGFYADPSLCRVGDDYYLINSTFAYFPGIPIFHSRDLVNWRQIGHVVSRPDQLKYTGLGVSRGIFAPAISHHNGLFYVVCTMVDAGGNFVVTAKDPAGPWSEPTWFDFEGIDPSLFFDEDGRAWLVNNGAPEGRPFYEGHRAIWIQEFDPAARRMIGPRKVLVNGGVDISRKPIWIEGPHLFRRGEWYYLTCAEGGTSEQHSQVVFRSRSVTGPFVPWSGNPILTQRDLPGDVPGAVTSTGHADLEIGPDGNWWAVFLGCRPYDGRFYHTGRETFLLPVSWTDDGWPVILPSGRRVPLVVAGPRGAVSLPGDTDARLPLTGNFTWRDPFESEPLSPAWIMLRTTDAPWFQAEKGRGLQLTPRRDTLSGNGNPSFLARRVQHGRFEASVTLEVPREAGVSAGIVAFQNETHHYFCGVRRSAAGAVLFVEKAAGGPPAAVASADIPASGAVTLRLRANEGVLGVEYALTSGSWRSLLEGADAKILTTAVAGGFVGAVVGVHARLEPAQ